MPLMDINDPAIQRFLKETYEKENRSRLKWIVSHVEEIKKAASLTREPTNYFESDVIANAIRGDMASITRDHVNASRYRRKVVTRDGAIQGLKEIKEGHSIVDVGLGDPKDDPRLACPETDLKKEPLLMRPVLSSLSTIIYKPKPEFGRVAYLGKRAKICPEKKYYYTECESWKYGWRLGDSMLKHVPQYGRCWHLSKSLRSRAGFGPDPPHYKSYEGSCLKCDI